MKKQKSIQTGLGISVFLVFMLACNLLAPSNNGANPPADESSQDNPFLPTGLPEINIPFSSESSNLEFIPNNIQASAPENGWINYYLELALKNNNTFSLQLYYLQLSTFALETGLPTVVINPGSTYVETKEGENYPVEFARLGSKIIPPGLLIKGFPEPIAVTFRIPEKLTPTNLVLSPGTVLVAPEEIENYTNGNSLLSFVETPVEIFGKETTSLLPNETQDYAQQPHQVNITEQVVADFPGNISSKLFFEYGDNNLTLELSVPLTNNDITSDQEFDINAFVTDQYGYQYSNNFCPDGYFDKLGPGQTNTLKMCFTLPPDSARLPRDLFLTYYWNKQEESYKIKIDNILSCTPSISETSYQLIDSNNEKMRQEISVPEEKTIYEAQTGSNRKGTIWTVYAPPNKDIKIKLIQLGKSLFILDLDIYGPDGLLAPRTVDEIRGETVTRFHSFCDGSYYFIVYYDEDYKVITEIEQ